ncbi:MAG: hypothetical protein KU37_09055 [Sulfuricurvum sp. PC08-66]|nr:MAG: hypothetical protein KU37_09055 [Sulfuricurvum sp. PC08-66]
MIAIDLGSNTLRAVQYECRTQKFGADFERMVKTAQDLHRTRRISPEAQARIIDALGAMRQKFSPHETIIAKTTAAMRQAQNASEVIEAIYEATGVKFEIIDAQEEARLTHLAVSKRMEMLGLAQHSYALIDIGGGSTELIVTQNGSMHAYSVDAGIVTLSEAYASPDALQARFREVFAPFAQVVGELSHALETLVLTAGTPTTIASMKLGMTTQTYEASRVNGTLLSQADLETQLARLLAMEIEERERYVGVGREALIRTGVAMLKYLYGLLGFEVGLIIDDGLREGIALDYCKA